MTNMRKVFRSVSFEERTGRKWGDPILEEDRIPDIVVCIPKSQIENVELEEADVAKREAAGEQGISYYWKMGRLPKRCPSKIYFAWEGAVRAYHQVQSMRRDEGKIFMDTKIHEIEPIPMESFRGFRYMKEKQ